MKSVYAILGIGVIIFMLGGMMAGLNAFRSTDVTEPHNVTLAGSENTTALITLANDVMDENKVNVAIYSPDTDDAPVAYDYVSATRRLTVNGLQPDTTRQLSIVYKVSRLDSFLDMMVRYFPIFLVLGLIAMVIGAAKAVWDNRG